MLEAACSCWLLLDSDAAIKTAHCTCMAGCGEVCSHVAAMAFFMCFDEDWASSCTGKLSQWNVPKTKKIIHPKKIKNIDFGQNLKTKSYKGKCHIKYTFPLYILVAVKANKQF